MKVKVVVGSSYGDEGKGLVSGCLAREAILNNKEKVLTVFFNGCNQRAHTFENVIRHTLAAGEAYGSDTFYHRMFVVDPIMLWLSKSTPIIDPRCRVILPCDVLYGQEREKLVRHGSCGFGLFAAVRRSKEKPIYINDWNEWLKLDKYKLLQDADSYYPYTSNEIHNLANFIRAMNWLYENCTIITFEDLMALKMYDTIIYEGGQGLLLDQENIGDFPHLTPSSTGAFNIHQDIEKLNVIPDLFYVSRSYITRHGRGPMDMECGYEDINPTIVDTTNQTNNWQGSLRFGKIDLAKLYKRIKGDAARYNCEKNINLVFTHLNYTNNKIETTNGRASIEKPDFVKQIWGSDKKDFMEIK